MIQRFLLHKQRPTQYGGMNEYAAYERERRSISEVNLDYLNKINSDIQFTVLRNAYAGGSTPGVTSGYSFEANYPVSNIYNSAHIHRECRTTGAEDPGLVGIYRSGISFKHDQDISQDLSDDFDMLVLGFNKFNGDLFSKVKYVNVTFRDKTTNALQYAFKFRVKNAYYSDPTYSQKDYMNGTFMETSKWNKEEGVIKIDKGMFVKYKQMTVGGSDSAQKAMWNSFTRLKNCWIDIWFESIPSSTFFSDPEGLYVLEDMYFSISNITMGRAYEILIDEGLEESIDDLSVRSKNNKTGTTFIEKNSYVKQLKFKISLFNDIEIEDFIRNISLGSLSSPLYFFPACDIMSGKSATETENFKSFQLDALWGGLYLMSDPKISNSQFDIHGTSITLDEYK